MTTPTTPTTPATSEPDRLPRSPQRPRIQEVPLEPNPDVVRHCELLLEYARSGELQGLMWTALWPGHGVQTGWSLPERTAYLSLIGELESMKLQMLVRHDPDVQEQVRTML